MSGNKVVKDKEVFLLNPITGEFDLALSFNASRIVTASENILGRPTMSVDEVTGDLIPLDPLVVTDESGNVILANVVADVDMNEVNE